MEAEFAKNPGHPEWFGENHKSLHPLHPLKQSAKSRLIQSRQKNLAKRDGRYDHPFLSSNP
jgi:hypothetical protein